MWKIQKVFILVSVDMNFNRNKVIKLKVKPPNSLSFHEIIGPCLVFGQLFGLVPVNGIMCSDETKIEFRWTALRTIYSLVYLFCGTADSIMGVERILRRGFSIYQLEGLIFFSLAAIRAFIFFHLAIKWKRIMSKWKRCEKPFLSTPYGVHGWSLSKRIRTIFVVLVVLGISKRFYLEREIERNSHFFQLNTCYFWPMLSTIIIFKSLSAIQYQKIFGTI